MGEVNINLSGLRQRVDKLCRITVAFQVINALGLVPQQAQEDELIV